MTQPRNYTDWERTAVVNSPSHLNTYTAFPAPRFALRYRLLWLGTTVTSVVALVVAIVK